MTSRSDSRVALVTGANRGLGRSIAVSLARAGHRVIVTHRPGGDASETLREIDALGGTASAVPLDISDVESLPAFVASIGRGLAAEGRPEHLDVLVNNAGVGIFEPLEEVTPESFDRTIGTNVRGTLFLIKALVPLMVEGGQIVTVSSSLTRHISSGTSIYAASKAAVEALSRSLAVELGPRGIRMNVVAPGPTATDFNGGAMRDDEGLRETIAAHSALGRVGEPDAIGDAIAAFVSDGFRWVTAERLEVSGGAFL